MLQNRRITVAETVATECATSRGFLRRVSVSTDVAFGFFSRVLGRVAVSGGSAACRAGDAATAAA